MIPVTCCEPCARRAETEAQVGGRCAGPLGAPGVAVGPAAREARAPDHLHGAVERAPAGPPGPDRHTGAARTLPSPCCACCRMHMLAPTQQPGVRGQLKCRQCNRLVY